MRHLSPLVTATTLAVLACARTQPPSRPSPPTLPRSPEAPRPPTYRFLPSGPGTMNGTPLDGGAVGVIEGGARSIVATDGTVQHAATTLPASLMGGVRVPTQLVRGFWF